MAIVYKIRRKSDGLFSKGGSMPHFSKVGKIWKRKGDLTSHLNQLWDGATRSKYKKECEIVTYEMVETQVGEGLSITEYLDECHMRKMDREAKNKQRVEEFAKQQRLKEYRKLQREFENVD